MSQNKENTGIIDNDNHSSDQITDTEQIIEHENNTLETIIDETVNSNRGIPSFSEFRGFEPFCFSFILSYTENPFLNVVQLNEKCLLKNETRENNV